MNNIRIRYAQNFQVGYPNYAKLGSLVIPWLLLSVLYN